MDDFIASLLFTTGFVVASLSYYNIHSCKNFSQECKRSQGCSTKSHQRVTTVDIAEENPPNENILVSSISRYAPSRLHSTTERLAAESSLQSLVNSIRTSEDVLSLAALAELTRSDNVSLHDSAIRILLDRAMTESYLPDILRACSDKDNPTIRQRALAAIQQLTKEDANKNLLVRSGALKTLVNALQEVELETCQRYTVVSLFRLVTGNDNRKMRIMKYGVLEKLICFLSSSPTHNNDLKYWSLLLVHQFSLTEELHKEMIRHGIIPLLAKMTRLTFGNTNMQKLCLHSLVRVISSLDNDDATGHLTALLELNMISMIASCLKNDDLELVSWAVFLMHEFVIKDVARAEFCKVRGILKVLMGLMGNDDTCIPRIILRTLKCLGIRNELFQLDMVRDGVIKKAVACLRSTDEETQYWALAILNDLVQYTEGHDEFIDAKGLNSLVDICCVGERPSSHVLLYVADILVYLCSSVRNHYSILKSQVLRIVLMLCKSGQSDAQYAGAALLLNLATISNTMIDKMVDAGAIELLTTLIMESERDSVQTVAAKTILTIGKKAPHLRAHLINFSVIPLISKIITMAPLCIKSLFPLGIQDMHAPDLDGPERPETVSPKKDSDEKYLFHSSPIGEVDGPIGIIPFESINSPSNDHLDFSVEQRVASQQRPTLSIDSVQVAPPNSADASGSWVQSMSSNVFQELIEEKMDVDPGTSTQVSDSYEIAEKDKNRSSSSHNRLGPLAVFTPGHVPGVIKEEEEEVVDVLDKRDSFPSPALDSGDFGDQNADLTMGSFMDLPVDFVDVSRAFVGFVDCLCIFLNSDIFDNVQLEYGMDTSHESTLFESMLGKQLSYLTLCLLDIMVMPLVNEKKTPSPTVSKDCAAAFFSNSHVSKEDHVDLNRSSSIAKEGSKSKADEPMKQHPGVNEIKDSISIHTTSLVGTLMKYECVKQHLLREKIFTIFVALIQERRIELMEQAVITTALSSSKDVDKSSYLYVPFLFTSFLRISIIENTPLTSFYSEYFMEIAVNHSNSSLNSAASHTLYARPSISDKTPALLLLPSGSEIRNDGWAFESVRCNYCIPANRGGKFAYEVTIKTDGIIQIGWATADCEFDPEGGTGVGDDGFSYAYDGHRRKKWHGISPKNNSYGEEWAAGDTITSLIDLDTGFIEYLRNGNSMGIAFRRVNGAVAWYPAISLASNQGCRIRFGDFLHPILYLPEGYCPISSLVVSEEVWNRKSSVFSISSSRAESQVYVDARSEFYMQELENSSKSPEYTPESVVQSNPLNEFFKDDRNVDTVEFPGSGPFEKFSYPGAFPMQDDSMQYSFKEDEFSERESESSSQIFSDAREGPIQSSLLLENESTPLNCDKLSPTGQSETDSTLSPNDMNDEKYLKQSHESPSPFYERSRDNHIDIIESNSPSTGELKSKLLITSGPLYCEQELQSRISFYFEIRCGLKGLKRSPQVGLYDRNDNIFLIHFMHDRAYLIHALKNPTEHDFWDSLIQNYVEAGAPTTYFENTIVGIRDLGSFNLEEGDILGVGVCFEDCKIIFTHNGLLLQEHLQFDYNQRLLFPFVRNLTQFLVNVGQRAFLYNKGNQDLINIIGFIEQP